MRVRISFCSYYPVCTAMGRCQVTEVVPNVENDFLILDVSPMPQSIKLMAKKTKLHCTIKSFLSAIVLSCRCTVPCAIVSYLTVPCAIVSYLTVPCAIVSYLTVPCGIVSYLTVPCAIVSYLTVPCAILSYLTVPIYLKIIMWEDRP
jgi:hypothetical protein